MNGLVSCTVDDLYESVAVRGGLTSRMKLEQHVNDMRAAAGTHAQPLVDFEGEEPVSGFAPTIPSRGNTVPITAPSTKRSP